jgi:hypothetical protein
MFEIQGFSLTPKIEGQIYHRQSRGFRVARAGTSLSFLAPLFCVVAVMRTVTNTVAINEAELAAVSRTSSVQAPGVPRSTIPGC